jgi:hypothetical protein
MGMMIMGLIIMITGMIIMITVVVTSKMMAIIIMIECGKGRLEKTAGTRRTNTGVPLHDTRERVPLQRGTTWPRLDGV